MESLLVFRSEMAFSFVSIQSLNCKLLLRSPSHGSEDDGTDESLSVAGLVVKVFLTTQSKTVLSARKRLVALAVIFISARRYNFLIGICDGLIYQLAL